MAATIKDVAARAGVAPSTVSRVLAGSSRISPETQERVREAMKELRYHPNAIARSLARRSTHTLGLIISRPVEVAFANPFFAEVIRGIGAVLDQEGYHLLLAFTPDPKSERSICLGLLRGGRVDGVLLTRTFVNDRLVHDLHGEGYPFVVIGRVLDDVDVNWVNNDNVAVGAMAAEHLLEQGHRRVALVGGPLELVVSVDRREGFGQALHRAGLEPRPEYEINGGFTREGGYRAMETLLALPEPPTAVVAADDAMALGAWQCCRDRGLAVPDDVAIIGVNDDPITSMLTPPLSTVRIPIFDLGAAAAKLLVEVLEKGGGVPRHMILPSELMIRASSAARSKA